MLLLRARKTKNIAQLITGLYLHGLAEGDFDPALRLWSGDEAPASASAVA